MFFCFGPPKSGTTLLQRCLARHPSISCPSEHQASYLAERMQTLFTDYNKVLAVLDQRTGGQGPQLLSSSTCTRILSQTLRTISEQCAAEKAASVHGLSDNTVLPNASFFANQFPRDKYVCIFRHPIPRAISAWHHNHRLAKEENNVHHLDSINSAGGNIEKWIEFQAERFRFHVRQFMKLRDHCRNTIMLRFEDLVDQKHKTLKRVFEFLDVDTPPELLTHIVNETDFHRMRNSSPAPHFFRKGKSQVISPEVSEYTIDRVFGIAKEEMKLAGYQRLGLIDDYAAATSQASRFDEAEQRPSRR